MQKKQRKKNKKRDTYIEIQWIRNKDTNFFEKQPNISGITKKKKRKEKREMVQALLRFY